MLDKTSFLNFIDSIKEGMEVEYKGQPYIIRLRPAQYPSPYAIYREDGTVWEFFLVSEYNRSKHRISVDIYEDIEDN